MTDQEHEDNIIFIGAKAPMNYVVAVLTEFKKNNQVVLKARGKTIGKAVETAEIVRKKFLTNVEVIEIKIDTEHIIDNKTQRPMDIPAIEIYLATPEE